MSADRLPGQFVDTNVLVYAYDNSAGKKHTQARQLIRGLWENQSGCLSIQVLQEFFINVTRKIANPLDVSRSKQIVENLSLWRVHLPETDNILMAIDIMETHKLSFWDAMVIESAISLGCKQIFSEDFSHGMDIEGVQVINPFILENS